MWIIDFGLMASTRPAVRAPHSSTSEPRAAERLMKGRDEKGRETLVAAWSRRARTKDAALVGPVRLPLHATCGKAPPVLVAGHPGNDTRLSDHRHRSETTTSPSASSTRASTSVVTRTGYEPRGGNDPRYTPTTCFETFPFPEPTSEAARRTSAELPGTWTKSAATLARERRPAHHDAPLQRGRRPSRAPGRGTARAFPLLLAHEALDEAVAAAYGWSWPMTDDEILGELLALNLARGSAEAP
jgi:hypothetical protein